MSKKLKKGQSVYDKLNGKKLIIHEVIDDGNQYRCRYWDERDCQYSFVHLYPDEINEKQSIAQTLGFKNK